MVHFEQKCIGELRERVAKGGDPTRLHEAPTEYDDPTDAQGIWAILSSLMVLIFLIIGSSLIMVCTLAPAEAMGVEEQLHHHADQSSNIQTADNAQEDLLNDIYNKATEVRICIWLHYLLIFIVNYFKIFTCHEVFHNKSYLVLPLDNKIYSST